MVTSADMKKSLTIANKTVFFSNQEVLQIKSFGKTGELIVFHTFVWFWCCFSRSLEGLHLVGFKQKSLMKPYFHVRHAQFIYPDENVSPRCWWHQSFSVRSRMLRRSEFCRPSPGARHSLRPCWKSVLRGMWWPCVSTFSMETHHQDLLPSGHRLTELAQNSLDVLVSKLLFSNDRRKKWMRTKSRWHHQVSILCSFHLLTTSGRFQWKKISREVLHFHHFQCRPIFVNEELVGIIVLLIETNESFRWI